MAESKLASPIKILKDVFSMLSLGHILISDLVVTNLFMHSLPSMILVYLAAPFYIKCSCMRSSSTGKLVVLSTYHSV